MWESIVMASYGKLVINSVLDYFITAHGKIKLDGMLYLVTV